MLNSSRRGGSLVAGDFSGVPGGRGGAIHAWKHHMGANNIKILGIELIEGY